jgi:hypothetical protein
MSTLTKTRAYSRCSKCLSFIIALLIFSCVPLSAEKKPSIWRPAEVVPGPDLHPQELLKLAEDFRALRRRGSGAPDYEALIRKQKDQLPVFRSRLEAIDPSGWEIHFKIDYLLLRAEMDALEFDLYVWRQTERNPSLYVNAAIGNVERLLTGGRRMGDNPVLMPYKKDHAIKILQALADTEKYLSQAKKHLVEFAPELADIALRHPGAGYYTEGGQLKYIVENYRKWAEATAAYFPPEEAKRLVPAAAQAAEGLLEFGHWLEENRGKMKGKYFIDKRAVDWYFRNVMLMPYTSDQILFMAEIERARAITYIQFELQKNRHLLKIEPARTTKEYLAWDDETSLILRRWYLENGEDILSDQEYQTLIRSEEGQYLLPFGLIAFPKEVKPGVHRIVVVPADHGGLSIPTWDFALIQPSSTAMNTGRATPMRESTIPTIPVRSDAATGMEPIARAGVSTTKRSYALSTSPSYAVRGPASSSTPTCFSGLRGACSAYPCYWGKLPQTKPSAFSLNATPLLARLSVSGRRKPTRKWKGSSPPREFSPTSAWWANIRFSTSSPTVRSSSGKNSI